MKKKILIAIFVLLAVVRIFSHSLFHGPAGTAPQTTSQHSTHQA